ncbi:MAG: T9SS-dependent M36 family metallopeptidase [Flavobacterium sp.]
MKKTTLFLFFLLPVLGFSQTALEKIQNYMVENRAKLNLTQADVSDLVITNDFVTADNNVFIYHVKQRINGIEVLNSDSNFLIQNDKLINQGGKNFISNINQKVNTATSTLSVTDGLSSAITGLHEMAVNNVQILESGQNKYKLSNGVLTDSPINAQLVYYLTNATTLKLAWDYEFYSQDSNHLWSVKIDAVDGKILDKKDLVISCNFGPRDNHNHAGKALTNSDKFTNTFLKSENQQALAFNPGTTNYRVIPWNYESPIHSARQLITNPESTVALAPLLVAASPNGWHNASTTIGASTTTYNYTRGNNAFAYSDYTNANPAAPTTYTTASAGAYPSLTFDFTYPGNSAVATTYIAAATTNLFYQNNIMHDLWYQYGFNEANKNFQVANFGRGGNGNDAVNAEAQDASQATTPAFNNANFSTPGDGSKPRMQMYLWNIRKPSNLLVNNGTLAGTNYNVNDNAFSPGHVNLPIAPASLTNNLVLFNDGTPDTSDACTAATNAAALNGKIAVIRRGTCTFAIKVKAAQTAGAIGAIVVNNAAGGISMAGADATITIPAVSMTQADGEALITAMSSGTVSVSISSPEVFVNADGDFDNGVISHEYTHGISTRLSGNCLGGAEQMGEGWSDWAWLMMQIKPGDTRNDARGIGTFVENQATTGPGIRQYRYSTDMAVNPHTYTDSNNQWYTDTTSGLDVIDVHGLGSIWCVMLWDLAWNYIDKYGYDPNIYNGTGGNNKVMKLVLDAIKIDGCDPTIVTGRDALIAADQATTGGQNYCMIWKTFARRGVGVGASSGANSASASDIQDQTASFVEPAPGPNCTLAVNYFENEDMIKIYPNPSNGQINIKINQFSGKVNLQIVDLNGRVVYSLNNTDFNVEKTINLSHLQSGMYIVKIDGSELNYTKKIILN